MEFDKPWTEKAEYTSRLFGIVTMRFDFFEYLHKLIAPCQLARPGPLTFKESRLAQWGEKTFLVFLTAFNEISELGRFHLFGC